MKYRYLTFDNIKFYVESFSMKGLFQNSPTKIMYQCFHDEGYALSELLHEEALAIKEAISNIKFIYRLK